MAFWASKTTGGEVIERGDGQSLIAIADTDPGPFIFLSFDVGLNKAGQVAFQATVDSFDSGLFVSDGTILRRRYLANSSIFAGGEFAPSIDDQGRVAFTDSLDTANPGIFRSEPDGQFLRIASLTGPLAFFGDLKINNHGNVVFEAGLDGGGSAVYLGTPNQSVPIAVAPSGPLSLLTPGGPSLNDAGTVAFAEELRVTEQAIFVRQDGVRQKVIGTGQVLDGGTVNNLLFCRNGLNNAGQLTFETQFGDGRVAIYIATPVH